jgi:hypothetical protein
MSGRAQNSSRTDNRRRAEIAKIKIAQKRLCLDDEVYRAIIERVCNGKRSAADLDETERGALLDEFKRLGFREGGSYSAKLDDFDDREPQPRLIRALWSDLKALGHSATLQKRGCNGSLKGSQSRFDQVARAACGERRDRGVEGDKDAGGRSAKFYGTPARATEGIGNGTMKRKFRDVREELRVLKLNEWIRDGAIVRECDVSREAFEHRFYDEGTLDGDCLIPILHFIDDRAMVWRTMGEAGDGIRREFMLKLARNGDAFLDEQAHTSDTGPTRSRLQYLDVPA